MNKASSSKDSFLDSNTGIVVLDQKLPMRRTPELRVQLNIEQTCTSLVSGPEACFRRMPLTPALIVVFWSTADRPLGPRMPILTHFGARVL